MKRICDITSRENGKKTKVYITWNNMLHRCYSKIRQQQCPTYIGCSVDPRWQRLSQFKIWFDANYVDGYHLDKDILIQGNMIYGPDTCCFIPQEINNLLTHNQSKNDTGYAGVSYHSRLCKYQARLTKMGCETHLGYFNDVAEAHRVYVSAKTAHANKLATEYYSSCRISIEIRDAIYNYDFSR